MHSALIFLSNLATSFGLCSKYSLFQRTTCLKLLNLKSKAIPFPVFTYLKTVFRYQLLCEMVDSIVGQANMIRSTLGLPERELVEDTSQEEG